MAPIEVTFYISNLPKDWNWQEHGSRSVRELAASSKCKLAHGPEGNIYSDSERSTILYRVTTLTVFGEKDNIESFEQKLRDKRIATNIPPAKFPSVDSSFYAINMLSETSDSTIDVYFIHGLGGHAFNTWSTSVSNGNPSTMRCWPRDFLPSGLYDQGLKANIYSIGYKATVIKSPDVDANIESTAENVIALLQAHRRDPLTALRPMYFVCHSLGGLVISKALILLLSEGHSKPGLVREYPNLFTSPTSECLVKGLCFLGTPFRGSAAANLGSKVAAILQRMLPKSVNNQLLYELRSRDSGVLDDIAREINYIKHNKGIEIVVGREGDVVFGSSPVVDLASSLGYFGDHTAAINLNGDHREIVKFQEKTEVYRALENAIINMMKRASARAGSYRRRTDPNVMAPDYTERRENASFFEQNTPSRAATMPVDSYAHPMYSQTGNNVHVYVSPTMLPIRELGPYYESQSPSHMQHRSDTFSSSDQDSSHSPKTSRDVENTNRRRQTPTSSPPPRSSGSGPSTARSPTKEVEDTGIMTKLRKYDTVFIVDDSASMTQPAHCASAGQQTRWELLQTSLKEIVGIATKYDKDGVDIIFLNSGDLDESKIKDPEVITRKLSEIGDLLFVGAEELQGTLYRDALDKAMSPKLDAYQTFFDNRRKKGAHQNVPKALNIIFITDGESDDRDETTELIINTAQQLNEMKAPKKWIGIQFVQIGDDKKASKWLKKLDDDLKKEPEMQDRDMIDTVTFVDRNSMTEQDFTNLLEKILLGGVEKDIDERDYFVPTDEL